jgi:hypothetical protein
MYDYAYTTPLDLLNEFLKDDLGIRSYVVDGLPPGATAVIEVIPTDNIICSRLDCFVLPLECFSELLCFRVGLCHSADELVQLIDKRPNRLAS